MDKVKSFLSNNGLMSTLFILNILTGYYEAIENYIAEFFTNIGKALEATKIAETAKASYDAAVKAVETAEAAYEEAKKKYSNIDTFYWNKVYQNKDYRALEKSLQGSKYYLKCQRDYISDAEIAKAERVIARKQKALDEFIYAILNTNNIDMTLEQAESAKKDAKEVLDKAKAELAEAEANYKTVKKAAEEAESKVTGSLENIKLQSDVLNKDIAENEIIPLRNEVASIFIERYNRAYSKLSAMFERYNYLSDNAVTDDEIDEYIALEELIEKQYEKVSHQYELITHRIIKDKIKEAKVEELQTNKNNPGYWMHWN